MTSAPMQIVDGIWLPKRDTHFAEQIRKNEQIDGRGTYQLAKLQRALSCCVKRGLAVDVGAHVGLWTHVLAREFARVVAVEPMADHLDCLRRNTEHQSNIAIFPVALGAKMGTVTLSEMPDVATAAVTANGVFVAPLAKLDSLYLDARVDFLKIDVEGYEHNVLLGGERTIRRDRPVIVIEHKKRKLDAQGIPRDTPLKLLKSWGATEFWAQAGDHCFGFV